MRVVVLALVLCVLVLGLPGLGGRDFWPPDEARYGQIARELGEPSWVIPHLNAEVYHDKPPLWFALVRGLSWFTGEVDESTSRLPSILGALMMVASVTWAAGRAAGSYAGLMSGLVLLTTSLFAWHTRVAGLDMLFAGFITAATLSFFHAFEEGKAWKLAFGFFLLALALLTKGPHAGLALAVILVWKFSARSPSHEGARYGRAFWGGVLIFLLVLGGWAYLAWREGGMDYLRTVVWDRGLRRVDGALAHEQPWFFFGKRLLSGAAPWILLPLAWFFPAHYSGLDSPGRRLGGFSFIWLVLWVGVLSVIPGKRSIYLLPALPAFAMLSGLAVASIAKVRAGTPKAILAFSVFVVSITMLALGVACLYAGVSKDTLRQVMDLLDRRPLPWNGRVHEIWAAQGLPALNGAEYFGDLLRHVRLVGLPFLLGGLLGMGYLLRRGPVVALEWTALGLIAGAMAVGACLLPHVNAEQSRRELGRMMSAEVGDAEIAMFRHVDEGALWYFGRPLHVIDVLPSAVTNPPTPPESMPTSAPTSRPTANDVPWAELSVQLKDWLEEPTTRYCLVRSQEMAKLEGLEEGRDYVRVKEQPVGHDRSFTLIRNLAGDAAPR